MSTTPASMALEIDGERVHIIDGLFDPVIIGMIERLVVDLPYFRFNYDKSKAEPGRHLRHDFAKSMIETFPLLRGFRDDVLAQVRQIDAARGEVIEQFFCARPAFRRRSVSAP
ncbi:MAG: hypothetical protein NVSMB69_03000 [Novosphingobium sp.]